MSLESITYSVLFSAVLVMVIKFVGDALLFSKRARARYLQVESDIKHLKYRYHGIFSKCDLLNDHASTYFHTLHEAGLGRLIYFRQNIELALGDCRRLFEEGKLDECEELMRFITRPGSKVYPRVQSYTAAKLEGLGDWEHEANNIVIACVMNLGESSEKTVDMGLARPNARRNTIHTLEELKSMLREPRSLGDL